MGLRFRKRLRVGPFRLNITQRGLRSVSLRLGPVTVNPTRRRTTVNLPSGLYYETAPQARPRPTACRCRCAALAHDGSGRCTTCPCRRYRRTR